MPAASRRAQAQAWEDVEAHIQAWKSVCPIRSVLRPRQTSTRHTASMSVSEKGWAQTSSLCFEEALRKVCRSPDLYPPMHRTVRRGWIRRFPYGLFYQVEAGVVGVIGVLHARRDPRCWQSRQ